MPTDDYRDRVCSGRELLENDYPTLRRVPKTPEIRMTLGGLYYRHRPDEYVRPAQTDIDYDHEEYDR